MKAENLLPIAAPAPPAVIMGIMLYNEIIAASGPEWWAIAGLAAFLGVVGMIGVEMYSYKQVLIAFARREIPAMLAALVGALITSGLIISAIYRSENSRPLVASVLIAVAGYVVLGVRDYMATRQQARGELVAEANRETDNQIRLLAEQRKLTNAEARRAKASGGQAVVSGAVHRTTGQQLDGVKLQATIALLRQRQAEGLDPAKVSLRDIEAAGIVGKSQAATYKAEALKQVAP